MEKLHRTRVIVTSSERLVVWLAGGKDLDEGRTSVECPHCGQDAIVLELERKETETEIADREPPDR